MQKNKLRFAATAIFTCIAVPASAQWSIGAPSSRVAPPGGNRWAYFVMANPVPGKEVDFNEWYNQVHLGDLGQLDGWVGEQRFRIVSDIKPAPVPDAMRFGYMTIWDLEGKDFQGVQSPAGESLNGGKGRRGVNAYNYNPGGSLIYTYAPMASRQGRPDGRKAFMPAQLDMKTPRPNRYIMAEYTDPKPGIDGAAYEAELDARINQVLSVSGWMGAQRFKLFDTGSSQTRHQAKYLILWETEGSSAQQVSDALADAVAKGVVKPLDDDKSTELTSYWQPITPYVTKDLFER